MNILLLSMPFGAIDRPALGISLLKAGLASHGMVCDVKYLTANFVDVIGLENYQWLTDGVPYTSFAGDWCFTLPLYGRQPDLDWDYVTNILDGTWRMSRADISKIIRIREMTPDYIQSCIETVDWQQYDLVGFTSTFVQNIASLALAKSIKASFPDIKIVFGGANWEDEMGKELYRNFSFVDYVCQGEADLSFPQLVECISKNRSSTHYPSGIVYRDKNGVMVSSGRAKPVEVMDDVRPPDFEDYFELLSERAALTEITPTLLMETSRGCWWGAKNHCTFCGLNGNGMGYRSKSPGRAFDELELLVGKWRTHFVTMVDNILDPKYFETFIARLGDTTPKAHIFYEVKANLSRRQVRQLAKAGVKNIQPGIESLSDNILRLMRKGTTGLRNIQLLKWCREMGVKTDWNILYGFPGETRKDYREVLKLLPSLRHLDAPSGSGPIRLDRFSPYFTNPEAYGLMNVRPLEVFKYIYPFRKESVRKIACYFDFDYHTDYQPENAADDTLRYVEDWVVDNNPGALTVYDRLDEMDIVDTRSTNRHAQYRLSEIERAVYLRCDAVTTVGKVWEQISATDVYPTVSREEIAAIMNAMTTNHLMICSGKNFLALGTYENYPWGWDDRLCDRKMTSVDHSPEVANLELNPT